MATHVVAVVDGVALRKESVDRNNIYIAAFIDVPRVALRKESVDRNFGVFAIAVGFLESLSARRAWIEILCCVVFCSGAKGRSPQGERG